MRVLVASTSGAGHFTPIVPWLDALTAAGHDVLVVGPQSLSAAASRWPFAAGADADPVVVGPLWGRLDAMSDDEEAAGVFSEIVVKHNGEALLPAVESAMEAFRPDVVLRDPMEFSSALGAARRNVPQVLVGISLTAELEHYLELAAPWLEEWHDGLTDVVAASTCWSRFPASVDPSSKEVRRYGVGRAPQRESDPRIVYATLGTVVPRMPHLRGWYDVLAASLAALDAEALLTVGRDLDPAALTVPPTVSVQAWADHEEVLGSARLVVHHGGSGTTLDAMAAGCAQVVVPLFADQPANGAMVERAGIGRRLTGPGGFIQRRPADGDAERLSSLLAEAMGDEAMPARAAQVAAEMACAPVLGPELVDGLVD